jgi:hypothetical protein
MSTFPSRLKSATTMPVPAVPAPTPTGNDPATVKMLDCAVAAPVHATIKMTGK